MQGIIDSGKYKIIEVLRSTESYEADLCIDVLVNNGYEMQIVNTYKGREAIQEFLPLYYGMNNDICRDFMGIATADGSVSAAFVWHGGEKIGEYFRKNLLNKEDYPIRLEYADKLLSGALELDMLDDRLAAAALDDSTMTVDTKGRKINFNYMVYPGIEYSDSFRCVKLGKIMRTVFPPNRYLPEEIDDFVGKMCAGKYSSCVEIYSSWREIGEQAAKTRNLYENEDFFKYLIRMVKQKSKRKK
jgi:hypothetical protein